MIASLLLTALMLVQPAAERPGYAPGYAQGGAQGRPTQPAPTEAQRPATPDRPMIEEAPVVTKHEVKVGDRTLKYTATTGMMPLRNREGVIEAQIFFMAYTLDNPGTAAQRPLMFSFNGGPGSASVWLHLGALGPKRVKMLDDGGLPPPP